MSKELASVKGIVDLTPDEALAIVRAFLVDQGYRPTHCTDTRLTVMRYCPNRVFDGESPILSVTASPQLGGGVRIAVEGNDDEGLRERQDKWIEWAESLPKKEPEKQVNSTAPRPQPASGDSATEPEREEPISEAAGTDGQVELLPSRVRIRRKGFFWAIGKGGDKEIPYRQLASLKFKSGFTGGYIYFVLVGQEDNQGWSRPPEYEVRFDAGQRQQFEEIKRAIEQRMEKRPEPAEVLVNTQQLQAAMSSVTEAPEETFASPDASGQQSGNPELGTVMGREFHGTSIEHSEAELGSEPAENEETKGDNGTQAGTYEEDYYYTPGQAVQLLGKDPYEINQMIYEKKLPVVRVDGYRWIPAEAVENLLPRKLRRELKKAMKPHRVRVQEEKRLEEENSLTDLAPKPPSPGSVEFEVIGREASEQEASEPQTMVHNLIGVLKAVERKRSEEEDAGDESSSLIGPDISAQQVRELEDELRALKATLRQYEIDRLDAELQNLRRGDTEQNAALALELEQERSLRAESEQWTRALQSELDEEREGRKQDNLGARYEIDQLDAELENLRRDEEVLRTKLKQEQFWRAESERWARELQAELELDKEQARRPATGESLALENSERYEREEYEERLAVLRSKLEELQSRLGENEAEKQALEKALSVEKENARRLEADGRVLEKVRHLLGAETEQPMKPAETTAAPGSFPAKESDGASGELLIKTRGGQWIFRPPFALEDEEVELIRLVAGEDEITADQIKHRTGRRRAVDDLADLLDRLADEGLEPITEHNDRYSFDPDFMQD